MARLPCTKLREWVDCAQGGQWPMYSRKGGSLDVVCSSERKKSGLTLRPQHTVPCPWRTFGESQTPSPRPLESRSSGKSNGGHWKGKWASRAKERRAPTAHPISRPIPAQKPPCPPPSDRTVHPSTYATQLNDCRS